MELATLWAVKQYVSQNTPQWVSHVLQRNAVVQHIWIVRGGQFKMLLGDAAGATAEFDGDRFVKRWTGKTDRWGWMDERQMVDGAFEAMVQGEWPKREEG